MLYFIVADWFDDFIKGRIHFAIIFSYKCPSKYEEGNWSLRGGGAVLPKPRYDSGGSGYPLHRHGLYGI